MHQLACRVVGVMEPKGASAFGMDQDDVVFMPYSTFSRRIMGNDRVQVFMASAKSPDRIEDAKEQITEILRRRRHIRKGDDDNFAVRDPRELQALLQSVTGMLTTLLAGVAAVSLVVGGIGIMNIMLVSVTERTREIGVRLAIGARAGDILTQFLVEAIALSAVGGVARHRHRPARRDGRRPRDSRAVRRAGDRHADRVRRLRARRRRVRRVPGAQGRAAEPAGGAPLRVSAASQRHWNSPLPPCWQFMHSGEAGVLGLAALGRAVLHAVEHERVARAVVDLVAEDRLAHDGHLAVAARRVPRLRAGADSALAHAGSGGNGCSTFSTA